jgi:hypothetical protein
MAWVMDFRTVLGGAVVVVLMTAAKAGHEVSYYPSFYPQEIRIEPLDPAAATKEFANKTDPLHAYIGSAPNFAGDAPADLKSVVSLRSFITVSINPKSARAKNADARCGLVRKAVQSFETQTDVIAHPYPITPYHADFLSHVDLVAEAKASAAAESGQSSSLTVRALPTGAKLLLSPKTRTDVVNWDVEVSEVTVDELLRRARVGANLWIPPPWVKEGWFQAYNLLRPSVVNQGQGEHVDAVYQRLTQGSYNDDAERVNLERNLVESLSAGCERAVIGYRLRREFYNDEFSNGIENIASDSQSGFNSGVIIRTLKLKDFPWNGWLRLGLDGSPEAAWNPVAGFTDAAGRLVWSTVGDAAFLPIPDNSRWVQNRAEVVPDVDERRPSQSMLIPTGASMPEVGTGRLVPVDPGKGAMGKITYRISASAFQDGTEMEPADLLYPYALAYRWGEGEGNGTFDPDVAATTAMLRERLAGVRVVRVDRRVLQIADLTFTYRYPIVEVYLNSLLPDEEDNMLIAPPWSSVPWHLLALMEAAVERNIAAFSQAEAGRRGVPWLDLVRDKVQVAKMGELIKDFAQTGYRPPALEQLVSTEMATARWKALAKFLEQNDHLLVTNGPYRLVSWSPQVTVLGVMRDFTYPVGMGTFDRFAYPPHAVITGVERAGDRVMVATDVEMAIKAQRDHHPIRKPLTRETLRDTLAIRAVPRYLIVGDGGKVVAAGNAKWEADGRFAAALPTLPSSGNYSLFAGIFLDGNTIDPSIVSFSLEGK